jgi:hypothetical protein
MDGSITLGHYDPELEAARDEVRYDSRHQLQTALSIFDLTAHKEDHVAV